MYFKTGALGALVAVALFACSRAANTATVKDLTTVGGPVKPLSPDRQPLTVRQPFAVPAGLTESQTVTFTTPGTVLSNIGCHIAARAATDHDRILAVDQTYDITSWPQNLSDNSLVSLSLTNFPANTAADFTLLCTDHVLFQGVDWVDYISYIFRYRDYPNYHGAYTGTGTPGGGGTGTPGGGSSGTPTRSYICTAHAYDQTTHTTSDLTATGSTYTEASDNLRAQCQSLACSTPTCRQQ